jgi:hypothetical protein
MQFSDSQIESFSKLYKDSFGEELDRKTAFEYAEKLYRMMELTYRQISVADYEALEKRREQTKNLNN